MQHWQATGPVHEHFRSMMSISPLASLRPTITLFQASSLMPSCGIYCKPSIKEWKCIVAQADSLLDTGNNIRGTFRTLLFASSRYQREAKHEEKEDAARVCFQLYLRNLLAEPVCWLTRNSIDRKLIDDFSQPKFSMSSVKQELYWTVMTIAYERLVEYEVASACIMKDILSCFLLSLEKEEEENRIRSARTEKNQAKNYPDMQQGALSSSSSSSSSHRLKTEFQTHWFISLPKSWYLDSVPAITKKKTTIDRRIFTLR